MIGTAEEEEQPEAGGDRKRSQSRRLPSEAFTSVQIWFQSSLSSASSSRYSFAVGELVEVDVDRGLLRDELGECLRPPSTGCGIAVPP